MLATLHTNDAPGAVARLLDMDIEPYLLSSALNGAVAQRLARTICPACATKYYPTEHELRDAELTDKANRAFRKGAGCQQCHDSGFQGRFGIYEVMEVTPEIRRMIHKARADARAAGQVPRARRADAARGRRAGGARGAEQPRRGAARHAQRGLRRRRRAADGEGRAGAAVARRAATAEPVASTAPSAAADATPQSAEPTPKPAQAEGGRMKFAYQAVDAAGKVVSDTIEAADANEAMDALRRQGLFVGDVRPAPAAARCRYARAGKRAGGWARGRRLKNMAMFTRQLSVLVASGTPLVQALAALERQTKDAAWREVVAAVRAEGRGGLDAVRGDGRPPVGVRRRLPQPDLRRRVRRQLRRDARPPRRPDRASRCTCARPIVGAMIYPSLLIVVAIAVLALMLLFVLPRFAGLFETLDVELPPMTQMLMACSDFLRSYWWAMPDRRRRRRVRRPVRGCRPRAAGARVDIVDAASSRRSGRSCSSFAVARIARVLGVLLAGKVPLLEALGAGPADRQQLPLRRARRPRRGSRHARLERQHRLRRPPTWSAPRCARRSAAGEQSGQMGPLLLNIADFLDEENEVVVKSLTSILEPIILIVLGLVVGFVALSMFLPLFDLTAAANG